MPNYTSPDFSWNQGSTQASGCINSILNVMAAADPSVGALGGWGVSSIFACISALAPAIQNASFTVFPNTLGAYVGTAVNLSIICPAHTYFAVGQNGITTYGFPLSLVPSICPPAPVQTGALANATMVAVTANGSIASAAVSNGATFSGQITSVHVNARYNLTAAVSSGSTASFFNNAYCTLFVVNRTTGTPTCLLNAALVGTLTDSGAAGSGIFQSSDYVQFDPFGNAFLIAGIPVPAPPPPAALSPISSSICSTIPGAINSSAFVNVSVTGIFNISGNCPYACAASCRSGCITCLDGSLVGMYGNTCGSSSLGFTPWQNGIFTVTGFAYVWNGKAEFNNCSTAVPVSTAPPPGTPVTPSPPPSSPPPPSNLYVPSSTLALYSININTAAVTTVATAALTTGSMLVLPTGAVIVSGQVAGIKPAGGAFTRLYQPNGSYVLLANASLKFGFVANNSVAYLGLSGYPAGNGAAPYSNLSPQPGWYQLPVGSSALSPAAFMASSLSTGASQGIITPPLYSLEALCSGPAVIAWSQQLNYGSQPCLGNSTPLNPTCICQTDSIAGISQLDSGYVVAFSHFYYIPYNLNGVLTSTYSGFSNFWAVYPTPAMLNAGPFWPPSGYILLTSSVPGGALVVYGVSNVTGTYATTVFSTATNSHALVSALNGIVVKSLSPASDGTFIVSGIISDGTSTPVTMQVNATDQTATSISMTGFPTPLSAYAAF